MSTNTIDAALLAKMFIAGARNLEAKKEWVNELNVFPVPDGDTGTNMSMTIESAVKELSSLEDVSMKTVSKAISSGSLRGARGNSGVILSQLCRGLTKVIRDKDSVDVATALAGLTKATETAYKAVMKPKEGTILTVARAFSDQAQALYDSNPEIDMEPFLEKSLDKAKEALEQTPELLPVLKEAGVVDSGGAGLIQILQGAVDMLCGRIQEEQEEEEEKGPEIYCIEFVLTPDGTFSEEDEQTLKEFLSEQGTEEFALCDGGVIKVHVHTQDPGPVLTKAVSIGRLSSVKVEALSEGHREKVVKEADRKKAQEKEAARKAKENPRKEAGFISVAAGSGLSAIFRDLGVDVVIEGGQTMNPSTDDILKAAEDVNADTVFILPNNKNIILAATQAQKLVKDRKVIVIPTKTIPQGIAAMLGFMPESTPEENEQHMLESASQVKTCQITYSIRDTHLDDQDIREGDIMGVGDKGILAVGKDISLTALDCVRQMMDEDAGLISVYYGQDVKEEEAQALADNLRKTYPDVEVELSRGDQPIYYYIISVE